MLNRVRALGSGPYIATPFFREYLPPPPGVAGDISKQPEKLSAALSFLNTLCLD